MAFRIAITSRCVPSSSEDLKALISNGPSIHIVQTKTPRKCRQCLAEIKPIDFRTYRSPPSWPVYGTNHLKSPSSPIQSIYPCLFKNQHTRLSKLLAIPSLCNPQPPPSPCTRDIEKRKTHLCLCFGFLLQMIYTYLPPFLRTLLHPSHNFLTELRTFMPRTCPRAVVVAGPDPCPDPADADAGPDAALAGDEDERRGDGRRVRSRGFGFDVSVANVRWRRDGVVVVVFEIVVRGALVRRTEGRARNIVAICLSGTCSCCVRRSDALRNGSCRCIVDVLELKIRGRRTCLGVVWFGEGLGVRLHIA